MDILDTYPLNTPQQTAATADTDVVVTAGAGSGKTRTLVGRTLALLQEGVPLPRIAAITFTDKAAREMRTRIRTAIAEWLAQDPPRRAFWEQAFADLDVARIGTIHSLCAQILSEHPVEAARAGAMPGFVVLPEGEAAVLRARAVEEALAWAAEDPEASALFALGEQRLRDAASILFAQRLDADAALDAIPDDPLTLWEPALWEWLGAGMDDRAYQEAIETLSALRATDPADKMEVARREVLGHAAAARRAREGQEIQAALDALSAALSATSLRGGRKANWPDGSLDEVKASMGALRTALQEGLPPLANRRRALSWALDRRAAGAVRSLGAVYRRAVEIYAQARQAENALDFDDLEAGALALLEDPAVRATWQRALHAVLVDEFQDTNERQRRIVYALAGFGGAERGTGTLFCVGDAKQSIYRFRGADVTVFRRVQEDVGRTIALDLTFRAHRGLVEATNGLLAPIMGERADPGQPYRIPFAPLTAHRASPRDGIHPPFIEFLIGLGESAEEARQAAAAGLGARLVELRDREGVGWQDVALLFRASSGFGRYEDALEEAGIPFVTVAGRGFYDRPEVRHLLNAAAAAADPGDDLALAGLLCSPLVGLTDPALYRLRYPPPALTGRDEPSPCALWPVLNHPALAEALSGADLDRALFARALIADLHHLAGRVPVAALLKELLDRTDYLAALRASGGARAQRNVQKLLADAHASGLVSVRAFAEYLAALRDIGARESEAPTEAGSAVQLMTVHKAKGLEFPIVVLADAAYRGGHRTASLLLDRRLGMALALPDEEDRLPASYAWAALRDADRNAAETDRLLYVAATRAREKLLVSAHAGIKKEGALSMSGWLGQLGVQAGLDEIALAEPPRAPTAPPMPPGLGCRLIPWVDHETAPPSAPAEPGRPIAATTPSDLVAPLPAAPLADVDDKRAERDADPPRRVWRVAPRARRPRAPAWAVGTLTHAALRQWRFAEEDLPPLLRPLALQMGIVEPEIVRAAIRQAASALRRFRAHPLWTELDAAQRWHELPYSLLVDGRTENGIIDLLVREQGAYRIVEFKTDTLPGGADLRAHIREKGYDLQMQKYRRAIRRQLGVEPGALWVLLNVGRRVAVLPAL